MSPCDKKICFFYCSLTGLKIDTYRCYKNWTRNKYPARSPITIQFYTVKKYHLLKFGHLWKNKSHNWIKIYNTF